VRLRAPTWDGGVRTATCDATEPHAEPDDHLYLYLYLSLYLYLYLYLYLFLYLYL
jgi:hypothetical protein